MALALVLGATGHIGAHVVRALLADGHEVRAAFHRDRFRFLLDGLAVEPVRVDLDTLEGLRAALRGCAWVFHAAGYYPAFSAPRDRAVAQGVESTRRILEMIRDAGAARVVFTSSAATIRRVPGRLANEDDAEPCLPAEALLRRSEAPASQRRALAKAGPPSSWRPLYATVKIAMEHEALRAARGGLPLVIVNPSLCVGEYDAHPFSGRALLAFAKYRVPFYVDHEFNAVYTGDVGVGHVRAAQRGRIGERYLLTARNITLRDFAALTAREAGVPPPRWRVPYRVALSVALASEFIAAVTRREPLLPRAAVHTMRMGQRLDGSKALRELSLPQTPLEEAIRRALAWFKAHGEL